MAEGIIDDVSRVAEGELPISQILGNREDIIALQGDRRDVAVNRLGAVIDKIRTAGVEGELPTALVDDAQRIANRAIYRGRKLVRRAVRRTREAREVMQPELVKLSDDLAKGKIDPAQWTVKYSRRINTYSTWAGKYWDKTNDDFVRIVSAGIDKVQRKTNIFEEPLSQELMGKLARVEAQMKIVKSTFQEEFLGGWLDDAYKLQDEIGKWKEWSLAKLTPEELATRVPEERVAEAVAPKLQEKN